MPAFYLLLFEFDFPEYLLLVILQYIVFYLKKFSFEMKRSKDEWEGIFSFSISTGSV